MYTFVRMALSPVQNGFTSMRAFSVVMPGLHAAGSGLGSNGNLHVGQSCEHPLPVRRHRSRQSL